MTLNTLVLSALGCTLLASAALSAPVATDYKPKYEEKYEGPQCDPDYYDNTYKDCGHTFEYVKEHYCPGYASTENGDCITHVATVFDKCIKAVDHHKGYCWDSKYFKKSSYEKPSYEEPSYKAPSYEKPSYKEPSYEDETAYDEKPVYKKKSFYAANHYEQPSYNSGYDSGYPLCKHKVEKPSWDNKGRGYGYENGKSCILPKTHKEQHYGSYEKPKYEEPKYEEPKYEEPKYEQPKYEKPKYEEPKYEEPKYEKPRYEAPRYNAPKYETEY